MQNISRKWKVEGRRVGGTKDKVRKIIPIREKIWQPETELK